MKIEVFDPAMCCSTGVCGPAPDPALAQFAADLDWLKAQGVEVDRFNLSQQPGAFAECEPVRQILAAEGDAGLPVIVVDGRAVSTGRYPTRQELAAFANLAFEDAQSLFSESVASLVAISAAVAANCEPCFKSHYDRARKLGVSLEDMRHAVLLAERVKEAPARSVSELAARYLGIPSGDGGGTGCCGEASDPQQLRVTTPGSGSGKCC